jgi:hypothetical protein
MVVERTFLALAAERDTFLDRHFAGPCTQESSTGFSCHE